MPATLDQPDNAARLERLGVAHTLPPAASTGRNAARELEALLASDETAPACLAAARRSKGADPVLRTCEPIEDVM